MKKDVYLKNVETDIQRLLSNMDRNRDSETFGCFSRPFWHDKVTDFPSAHQQIGVMPLTIAYTENWEENPFYGSKQILDCIEGAMKFWSKIQKRNGSFDEHYPNEHSMGAAAWTLWAVTESYLMLEETPDIESSIERAVKFLRENDEPGDIANHQAVVASAIINSHRITGCGIEGVKKRIETLGKMQDAEGWFQEYIGADIGYQSTSISHIARVWEYNPNLVDDSIINSSLDFFSSFIDEKNYYSGIIGSRNTQHIHSTGFEILSEEFEKAKRIAGSVRKNRYQSNLLEPGQMDDKHLSRQLAEYLDSYRKACSSIEKTNEVKEQEYRTISVFMPENDTKLFLNTSKGGVYKKYRKGELVETNNGISIRRGRENYTSNWPGVVEEVQRNGKTISFEGQMRKIPRNTLPSYYFLGSRLFNYTLGKFPRLSLTAKNILISLLIDSDNSGERFKREIQIEDEGELNVRDDFNGETIEGRTRTNFVPSSEFFDIEAINQR